MPPAFNSLCNCTDSIYKNSFAFKLKSGSESYLCLLSTRSIVLLIRSKAKWSQRRVRVIKGV